MAEVLLVCNDLFFSSQLAASVARAGVSAETAMFVSQIPGKLAESAPRFVVVDLEMPSLDLPALLASLAVEPRPRVIAFGPHVHVDLLHAAQEAGCDHVLTRGQIAGGLEQWLRDSA